MPLRIARISNQLLDSGDESLLSRALPSVRRAPPPPLLLLPRLLSAGAMCVSESAAAEPEALAAATIGSRASWKMATSAPSCSFSFVPNANRYLR